MSRHKDRIRMRHMLDCSREALALIEGKTLEEVAADRVLSLALIRLLEVVGEAAARVTTEGQDRFPRIPWSQIVGLRNRLIHGYDSVDLDILWNILSSDLPLLLSVLEPAIAAESSDE